jgi:type I restriction-modification system DNA methylase subunit
MNNLTKSNGNSPNADLQQRIIKIYDHLYANAPTRTPSGIGTEVGKILHTAMFMENGHTNLFSEKLPAFDFDRITIRKLLRSSDPFVAHFASGIRVKFDEMVEAWGLYPPSCKINLGDFDIAYTCYHLNGILISNKQRDVFGDALEIFRGQWAKRSSGQFFTDPLVTHLAISMLNFNPFAGDDLVDICSGTGGFLLAGLNHIHSLLKHDTTRDFKEMDLVNYAVTALKGQEIDSDVCEIANATLSSRLSIQSNPIVSLGDSLQPDAFSDHPRIKFNAHLCAATNPPFGTKITIKDEKLLRSYELASNPKGIIFRSPDILFIEQNLKILKAGQGRLAIVTPYQILSGPQTRFIREWIIRNAQIIAVVDLPADTFQPHTGTKTSLVILKKRAKPLNSISDVTDPPIFMSIPRWIGHDRRGTPIYKRSGDGKLTDEILTDIPLVGIAFDAFVRHEDPFIIHEESFAIELQQILKDPQLHLNAQFHRPLSRKVNALSNQAQTAQIEWKFERLGNLVKRIFYPTRFKRNYVDYYPGAVPFLGGSNISQLLLTTDKWLSHDDPKLDDLRVSTGWILVTRSGSTGIIASVPEVWNGYAMSEHIIRIIPDPEKINPTYLNIVLRTQHMQEKIARGVFGSVIDEITPEYLADLEIPVPVEKASLDQLIDLGVKSDEARNLAIVNLVEAIDLVNINLNDLA